MTRISEGFIRKCTNFLHKQNAENLLSPPERLRSYRILHRGFRDELGRIYDVRRITSVS